MSETFHLALSNGSEVGAVDPEWTWGVMEPGGFCPPGDVDRVKEMNRPR